MRYNSATPEEEIYGLQQAISEWDKVLVEHPHSFEARTAICKLNKELQREFVRQSMFRDDGTQTDVPTRDSEKPQLEKQLNMFGWADGIEKLKELKVAIND